MSERFRSMSDEELGGVLSALDLAWPSTPDLAQSVMAATRSRQPRVVRLPLSRSKRILLIAAAAVLLLAGAAVAARLIIDLGAVVVEFPPSPSEPLPTPSIAPTGEPITLRQAGILLGQDVRFPARLGRPDRLWADEVLTESGEVARVTLAWRTRPDLPEISDTGFGAVLMIFEGDANLASKSLYEDTGVLEFETVDGTEYYWTTGTHSLELLTSEGVVDLRVEGNVLLWTDAPYTMRLETELPKAQALSLAGSMTTGTS
jgi:hypothetical protein